MTNLVSARPSDRLLHDAKSLALIRRTVAKDTNDDEFGLFISMARALRLDPLRRQIHALFVFAKDDPHKRRMAVIVAIDGFRTIAERTGTYRPDEEEPSCEVDPALQGPLNPAGLVKATVRVHKFAHGGWHKVTASAYWDEYVPLKDQWVDDPMIGLRCRSGAKVLDPLSPWARMPRLMLAKVAEALALRKAWPDDFSSVFAAEELDRSQNLSPAEQAQLGAIELRQARLGGPALLIDWGDGEPLASIPLGQFADRAMAFIEAKADAPAEVIAWADRNRHSLREFWAHNATDALTIKKRLEYAETLVRAATASNGQPEKARRDIIPSLRPADDFGDTRGGSKGPSPCKQIIPAPASRPAVARERNGGQDGFLPQTHSPGCSASRCFATARVCRRGDP
jgi:phage recombination protein Bet